MEPTTVLPVISLLSLVSVEYGGCALLGFLTGPRPARGVPRTVLPGRPRPCRCAAGALARLLPLPRQDRVPNGGSVACGIASARGDHRSVGRLLPPSRAGRRTGARWERS